ncbi:MAG: hypothetical protein DMD73_11895 [Gemmatimonadetes bacterium]|nr:MAG: hypothetical protein DMD73_11895 [Gemmatimonadota bacterium]
MTHALYLLDPEAGAAWAPFLGARPLCELRAGAHLIRERWEAFVGAEAAGIFALPHLVGFTEPGVPAVTPRRPVTGPAVIGSSTFAPRGLAPALPDGAFRLTCGGITVGWGVARFLGEAGAYARELKPGWPALAAGDVAGFFGAVRPVAVDVAVLERTKRLAVVAGTFRWDDIGSWDALLRIRKPDARGNVVVGNVTLADDVRRSVVWSDSEHLAVIGLEDMVVVRANGHTLVMPTGRAERLKQLVQHL